MNEKISISLDKKLIEEIKSFCKLNGKRYLEYITTVLETQLALDMYGDLNEKIKPKKTILANKVEEVKVENVEEPTIIEEIPLITNEPITPQEPTISILVDEEKPKKKRRTLNVK